MYIIKQKVSKIIIIKYVPLDIIDIVKDQLYGADYIKEEDPKSYVSDITGRGPLSENWISEYWKECQVIKTKYHLILTWYLYFLMLHLE